MEQALAAWQQGGVTLVMLVLMSIIALGIGLERATAFRRFVGRLRHSAARIQHALSEGQMAEARAINKAAPGHPATALLEAVLSERAGSVAAMRRQQRRVVRTLRSGIWLVGTVAATAPFVGLFGTVLGVMDAFAEISKQGGGGFEVVSGGISEALITTAGGILVGIEAMFLFNYLQTRGAVVVAEMRDTLEEFNELMEERRGVADPS